jgi:hypothetical protein
MKPLEIIIYGAITSVAPGGAGVRRRDPVPAGLRLFGATDQNGLGGWSASAVRGLSSGSGWVHPLRTAVPRVPHWRCEARGNGEGHGHP